MSLVQVDGHGTTLDLLQTGVRRGAHHQSVLLTGPSGIGKLKVAQRLAQALLCAGGEDEAPCGACRGCRLVAASHHPDLVVTEPGLKIDAVRELQRQLLLSPTEGAWRVAVLQEIDRSTPSAANALLKTLEEPPGHVAVILTSSSAGDVLPTIRSRCQSIPLRPLADEEVHAALMAEGQDSDQSLFLARLAHGRVAWALDAARDPEMLQTREAWLARLEEALSSRVHARMAIAEELSRRGDVPAGIGHWRSWFRDVMLLQSEMSDRVVNIDRKAKLQAAADSMAQAEAAGAVRLSEVALTRLAANANKQLTLESLLLELPR